MRLSILVPLARGDASPLASEAREAQGVGPGFGRAVARAVPGV